MRLFLRFAVVFAFLLPAAAAELPYDVRSYDVTVEPDFNARTLHLVATVTVDNPKLAREFEFSLTNAYTDVKVTADGQLAPFEHKDRVITVRPKQTNKLVKLRFELRGPNAKSRSEEREVIEPESLFLIWSDQWYPVVWDDWASVRTTVTLPKAFRAIAPGKLVASKNSGGRNHYIFQTSQPAVCFSVFADSRWVERQRTIRGIRFATLLDPESDRKYADLIFETSADVVHFYSKLYGGYPFDQFSFVTVPRMYARRAFNGWIGYTPEYLEKEMLRTGYDAHETALLWWGYTSRGDGPGAWQWTEGLGDYAEFQYAEARNKPLAEIFIRQRDKYLATPPEKDLHYTELRGNSPQELIHGKYPWIMHALRQEVGDEAFVRGGRKLFSSYKHRVFTMDEFIAVFESASGKSLKAWRAEWFEAKGKSRAALVAPAEKTRRDMQQKQTADQR